MTPPRCPVVLLALLLLWPRPAGAQLAQSFYNVTDIQTKVLPNAVQVVIRTDGTVQFGGDQVEFLSFKDPSERRPGEPESAPRPVTAFRLRLLHARSKVPAFVEVGAYPVDAAVVTLGTDEFKRPFFSDDEAGEPQVDIQLRFYVPVRVQRFIVDRQSFGFGRDYDTASLNFSDVLGPLEVEVELGNDRRSIVVTVISDRVETSKIGRLRRSPPDKQKHHLTVQPVAPGAGETASRFRLDVLHTPLAQVLDAVTQAGGPAFTARADAAEIDVSLLLPAATSEALGRALQTGYGVVVQPRSEAVGGYIVGRGGPPLTEASLPLHHLEPERARRLFPDFLLPFIHADTERNALQVSGTPELVARLRRDLEKLDRPHPQVRIEATAWELTSTDDAVAALRVARAGGERVESVDTGTGQLALRLEAGQVRSLAATLTALAAQGRARLAARPFVVVAAGEEGSVFSGQARFITVLQRRQSQQVVQALRLQIGSSLTVRPTVGASGDLTLDLTPRVSTVDEVETGTGLPTLGIREVVSVVRVQPGDAVLLSGLDLTLPSQARRRVPLLARLPLVGKLFGARRKNRVATELLVLVSARVV